MFPGAVDEHESPAYVIIGAPLDNTTSFIPGTRFGPAQIRHYARHFDDYDRHSDGYFSDRTVLDHGDIHAGTDTDEYLEFLRSTIVGYDLDGAVPIILGGEHTVSLAGVNALEPDHLVTIDAHLDLRDSYDGDPLHHATICRRALEVVDSATIIGARTGSKAEWDRAEHDDVTVVPPESVGEWEPSFDGTVYLSVDIDGLSPAHAPGTGTPEPFGLSPMTVRDLVRTIAPRCIGFDVVEVNDRDHGQAATLGAKLIKRFIHDHATNR